MISFANLQTSCYKGGGNGDEVGRSGQRSIKSESWTEEHRGRVLGGLGVGEVTDVSAPQA